MTYIFLYKYKILISLLIIKLIKNFHKVVAFLFLFAIL